MAASTYDSLAYLDTKIFPHEYMIHDRYIGLVDSVRARNPDFVPLNYVWAFGANEAWATSSGVYREVWDAVNDNDWWMRTTAGDVVYHDGLLPGVYVRLFNPGAGEELAAALADIYVSAIEEKGNLRQHVGFFVDWLTSPYPDWPLTSSN